MTNYRRLLAFGCTLLAFACSSAPKTTPELRRMHGKKVALVAIEGESTEVKIIEVALVNQLMANGSFFLISKEDVNKAKKAHDLDPRDWMGLAKRVGADYALRAKVIEFAADTQEGFSKIEVEDSQLAAERGEKERKTERVVKAARLDGRVKVELEFTAASDGDRRIAVAEAEDQVSQEADKGAIHLPPKLRFLETLTNKAFKEFFDRYN